MADLMEEALQAVQELEDSDDEELFRQLGLRVKAIERDPSVAGQFAPPRALLEPRGIALGDVIDVGRKAFARLSKSGYGFLCSGGSVQGSHFDALVATLGTNRMAVTAGLATLLVAQVGLAPAIAGVVAALAIGKAAPASLQGICSVWALKAGYAGAGATTEASSEATGATDAGSTPQANPEPPA